jgi:hypothetical protein
MNKKSVNIRPRYLTTLHSRYYRLPKVLWDYIWRYDDRYRIEFKNCLSELNYYFNHNRLNTRILHEIHIFNIYASRTPSTLNLYNNVFNYSEYFLKKLKIFGDNITDDNLDCKFITPLKLF